MLAPKIRKPQTKTSRSHSNSTVLQTVKSTETSLQDRENGRPQPAEGESVRGGASWEFGTIPIFPADPPHRSHRQAAAQLAARQHSSGSKIVVGEAKDPQEEAADRTSDKIVSMPVPGISTTPVPPNQERVGDKNNQILLSKHGEGATTAGREAPEVVHDVLRTAGQPIDAETARFFEPRFGHDFSDVRIHADAQADVSARAVGALAYTVGQNIVFGQGRYEPRTNEGRRLLAHELTHVVQQRRESPASTRLQRSPSGAVSNLKAGDDVKVEVYSSSADSVSDRLYSRTYHLSEKGVMVIEDGRNTVIIELGGLSPHDAAKRIADRLVEAELFRGPRVCITAGGMTACADAKAALSGDAERAYANFMAYIRTTKDPPEAVARYYQWVSDHRNSPEFTQVSPPELWKQSLRPPERKRDPEAERTELWIDFMKRRQAEDKKLAPEDQARATETMRRFQDWYEKHRGKSEFAKASPAAVYADISVAALKENIETKSKREVEARKQAAEDSPEVSKAKGAKFDEFLALAKKLWGYSSRKFPYSIPLNSQGKDILVTGDPELQHVLDSLAAALVRWASNHMSDSNYATVSVNRVLLDLLEGGYSQKISEAQSKPLEHETIDRNELSGSGVLAAFGETVATGLLVIGVVGLFVGAEIITAGQATWLLAGAATYSGVKSYVARRDEIENSGYHVSVAETLLDSAGDVIGVSQLIEGITGQRLGLGTPMGSEARSASLGAGGGNIFTLLVGSRAYRTAEGIGQSARLSRPGLTPSGPNAQLPVRPAPARPTLPEPNPKMGDVERGARAALPENLRKGLDLWSAEVRKNGGNPETVFSKLKQEKIQAQSEVFLKRHEGNIAEADQAAHEAARATDDPLRPKLKNVEPIPNERVTLHYETRRPAEHEVAQAIEISKRTGESVHLFGDTASGIDYPGIDGTIGNPPRPLSLKSAVAQAHPNLARKMAGDAQLAAKNSGYTHVEVHIEMLGRKIADIKAAWDAQPPLPSDPLPGPAFDGSVISRIVIRGSDGVWQLTPPLAGPPLTGVSPVPSRPERKDQK